ncbi:MAG: hypothetical protein JWM90_1991 [Thermoleophilia bacterium]|nr:hypothetical protein [Thermoleophilia bacterium]
MSVSRRSAQLLTLTATSFLALALPAIAPAAGGLDPSFGTDGAGTYNPTVNDDGATGVATGPDGRIVFVGGSSPFVGRVTFTGAPDPTFGGDGFVTSFADLGNVLVSAGEIAVQPDNKVLLSAYSNGNLAAIRLLESGALDTNFGVGGVAEVPAPAGASFSYPQYGIQLSLHASGSIYLGGRYQSGGTQGFATARINADGAPASGWGTAGVALAPIAASTIDVGDMALDGDRVLIAGRMPRTPGFSASDWAIARFSSTGAPDSFGGPGYFRHTFHAGGAAENVTDAMAMGIGVLPNHHIVVAGSARIKDGAGSNTGLAVHRFTEAGAADPTFNGGAHRFVEGGSAQGFAIHGPTGHYLVGTSDGGATTRLGVTRILSTGAVDTSWGLDGLTVDDLPTASFAHTRAIAVQANGAVLAVGDHRPGADIDAAVMRLLAEAPAPPTPPTPPVTDSDGDGLADNVDCAPGDRGAPLQGAADANCNGVSDTVEAQVKLEQEVAKQKLVVLAKTFATNTKNAVSTIKQLPKALPAAGLISTKGTLLPIKVTGPSVVIVQGSILMQGARVVSAGGGNVVSAGGGNVVAAGGMNVIAAGGGNVVAAGGMNLIGRTGDRAKKPKGKQVLLGGGGMTFRTAGAGKVKYVPTPAGRKIIAAWRLRAKQLRAKGSKVAPLKISITTIVGPLEAKSVSAVYSTKVVTVRP